MFQIDNQATTKYTYLYDYITVTPDTFGVCFCLKQGFN